MVVVENPLSTLLQGTYHPENDTFPITGLTSIICPTEIGTERVNWGAIKSLYK
jgi:hypothetical protein